VSKPKARNVRFTSLDHSQSESNIRVVDFASKEVIISAGSLDSPKILLLSGIGPEQELASHGIKCAKNLPGVGKNLQDHPMVPIYAEAPAGYSDIEIFGNPEQSAAARTQFMGDGTGPFSLLNQSIGIAFIKADEGLLSTPEFKSLPQAEQDWIKAPTVPSWEMITHVPPIDTTMARDKSYVTLFTMLMVQQSRGTVTLASADPSAPPVCDPQIYSHPFDRVNHINALRNIAKVLHTEPLASNITRLVNFPKSTSDEDLWEFLQDNAGSTYHMTGTVKMGKAEDDLACVDTRFRVRGIEGLRVADMSVLPFVPNCHTQSVAYLTGQALAEKLTEEYKLD
jgi:choline dehydrogenase-like flavoprotein